jgi:ABC-2 type transport system permease protein
MMNKYLFRMEFKRNAPSLFIWSAVISLLVFGTMAFFPTFLKNQQQIMGFIQMVPQAAMKARGFANIDDLFSALGFYAANNIVYMMLMGSIFSMVLAANMLLKEEYNKTAEYLLSKPLTRGEIYFTKLAVVLLNIFIINLITSMAGFFGIEVFSTSGFSFKAFIVISLYTLFLNLLFGSAGYFVSLLSRRMKPMTFFSTGLVLVCYFLYTISRITESADKIGYLSPFKYVDIRVLQEDYHLESWRVLYLLGISLLFITGGYFIYRRKDILT